MSESTTSRVTLAVNGLLFATCTHVSIRRDLRDVAGTFDVALMDEARIARALFAQVGVPGANPPLKAGDAVKLSIDGEPVLVGWIERPRFHWRADAMEARIAGRDKTGDLVECAALPNGPTEFRGVDLLYVARQVCAPFGIPVRAETDIGAAFDRLALHPHMTAIAFLESAARQRATLLTSDGIGGLLLTRGGATRAPAALRIGENAQEVEVDYDWCYRFSDYFVKQQTARRRSAACALTHGATLPATPAAPPGTPGAASATEAQSIMMTGHAIDPEVTRWRPTVVLTRSQSGMSTVQEQAEWALRVARGQSDHVSITVPDWRAGPDNALWRPNQVVTVWDPYSGIDRDMLIAGVQYDFDARGARTRLRVVSVTAYDRINEADRRRGHHGPRVAP